MVPTAANGQPALAAYCRDNAGVLRLHTLQVLTVTAHGIARNVVFQDPRVFKACEFEPNTRTWTLTTTPPRNAY